MPTVNSDSRQRFVPLLSFPCVNENQAMGNHAFSHSGKLDNKNERPDQRNR